ncbi:MAG: enoyl-CoA hydratase/isomerase family protein [Pseudolabrys sp.]|nr:enoyl-CoA hydratase/isomerase family protein [Pseudolabrys sp.]MDP2293896.1 enoyl-CoA hydratase/isomerase family protein [Pseudolabrys sp.]
MQQNKILYSVSDRVATITLNRPEVKNALDQEALDSLVAAIEKSRLDDAVWVLVINGTGPDFCPGQDVKELSTTGNKGDYFEPVFMALKSIYKPVICAARGLCLAGGAGIAMGADIRILSETARMGWPHAKIGLCSIGGPSTLARMIPVNIALEYMFTGDLMPASRALQLNLTNHVVADVDLEKKTSELVAKLLANAPLSISATKKSVLTTQHLPYADAVSEAHVILNELMKSADAKEGMLAFVEKRRPIWTRN